MYVMPFLLLDTWLLTQRLNKQTNRIIYIINVVAVVKNWLQRKCKGKKKALLVQAMKARGKRGIAPLIPNHGTRWR
jgi:hypothetical protein